MIPISFASAAGRFRQLHGVELSPEVVYSLHKKYQKVLSFKIKWLVKNHRNACFPILTYVDVYFLCRGKKSLISSINIYIYIFKF